tara:strand:- start:13115 stop:13462 length:348 start_codon:yes stop_codon:yes gene_type:complete
MTPARTTPEELRQALLDLALLSGSLLSGRAGERARRSGLIAAICRASALARAEIAGGDAGGGLPQDPERLVRAWIRAGGKHRDLVACLSSSSKCLEFSSLEKERDGEKERDDCLH